MSAIDFISTTPGQNSHADAAQAIPVAEGAPARFLNDAVRQILALLKQLQVNGVLWPNSVAGVRSLTAGTPTSMVWMVDLSGALYFYKYDATETGADDGDAILVDAVGRRWVRSGNGIDTSDGAATTPSGDALAAAFAASPTGAETLKDLLIGDLDSADLDALNADYGANSAQLLALATLIVGAITAPLIQAIVADIDADTTSEVNLASALVGNPNALALLSAFAPGNAAAPSIRNRNDTDTGIDFQDATVRIYAGGQEILEADSTDVDAQVPFRAPNGSSTAPAYSFGSQTGTGMYLVSSGVLGLSIGGVNYLRVTNGVLHPTSGNVTDLGTASLDWRDIYTLNAVTVTSDARLKTDFGKDREALLERWGGVDWTTFRMQSSVQELGDAAPLRVGLVAQDLERTLGQSMWRLNMLRHIQTDEVVDEETAKVLQPAVDRYAVIYEEALATEAMWTRRELRKRELEIDQLLENQTAMLARIEALEHALQMGKAA